MTNLMISYDFLFLIGKYCIFLLISCDNDFYAFFQICFCYNFTIVSDCTQCCLIYDVGKLCSGSSGSHSCNRVKINII